ncbi:single stranded DNA-binding protein [Halopolyspora algeriensis]|uniref:Single-stranded DNA-binding protein n=1 Tax=Halopolyspora algeriensis TaxID=1500506 RepID=A0A368VTN1_9ACTN|nr:single-stranded DNA-binding protein [Halopolyspora algeriensis]RCW45119.1 single stranded DNA-binding protein [Halopolyspora algeriensis]TQM53159.1 single stranded DNA-binding protein [Halopolyspora algeriensis]
MFETTVTLVGNAISPPKVRETAHGSRVANFRMVSTARRFDKTTEQWVDGDRVFATVNCWRKLADAVADAVYKNDPVVVTGRLRTRDYEVDGQRRSSTEIEATAVGLDLARSHRAAGPEEERPRGAVDDESRPTGPAQHPPPVVGAGE